MVRGSVLFQVMEEGQEFLIVDRCEEVPVDRFDVANCSAGQLATGVGHRDDLAAGIRWIALAFDQPFALEGAQHLGRHHHVRAGKLGHTPLTGLLATLMGQPPG